jgi:hypothetical protein
MTIEQLREAVIQAARAVSENADSGPYGFKQVETSLVRALEAALDALDKGLREGRS